MGNTPENNKGSEGPVSASGNKGGFVERKVVCEGLPERTVDLLIPFRNYWFHHRDQHGRASLKDVLPALTGTDYSHLEIQDGNAAARAFTAAEFGDLPAGERELLRNNLLQYCGLDTQAMVDLLGALEKITD